ncbi:MAG: hypothetical protein QOK39_1091 [Acidimicrobiaceae bacterium]|jgi:anti-sigma regulatory factor (Ser/Thr protein kinase)|nr:hypothetical protein [Acidimicrobiaceae bacterium]
MPSITLQAEPENVMVARRFVDDALAGVDVDRHLAALLVTELVSNVVTHASTDFEVVVAVSDPVRIEVHDGVAVTEAFRDLVANPPRQVDPGAHGGRGWVLVATLATRFGLIDRGSAGKAVWIELPRDPERLR